MGRIGMSSGFVFSLYCIWDSWASFWTAPAGSLTSSSRLSSGVVLPSERSRSSRAALSAKFAPATSALIICCESLDFLRLRAESLRLSSPSGERRDSPERRRIDWTLFSRKCLNSDGASSGCTLAGTQRSREGSFSSSSPEGAREGMAERVIGGMSGSMLFPTSIERRLSACRLLSSWAISLGLLISVRGNRGLVGSLGPSRRESGSAGDCPGDCGPRWPL